MPAPFAQIRALIERTDPDIPARSAQTLKHHTGEDNEALVRPISRAARDSATIMTTLTIHQVFLDRNTLRDLAHARPEQLEAFVLDGSTLAAQHLRRNSLLTCTRVLAEAGRMDPTSPLEEVRLTPITTTAPRPSRTATTLGAPTQVQQDTATNDEVLLLRLSAKYVHSRYAHRSPAALSILTSGAGPSEGALVRWIDRVPVPGSPRRGLSLPGAHLHQPSHGRYQAPRIVALDAWEDAQLNAWQGESGAQDDSQASMIYTSLWNPATISATKSFIKAFELMRSAAALQGMPGATPGAVSFWAAAHAVVFQGLEAGAAIHGTDPANLLRKLTHVGDRAY